MRKSPVLSAFCVLAMMATAAPLAAQEAENLARPARIATVEVDSPTIQRLYPAIVLPSQEAVISFRVSGQVVELPIRAAQQVKVGDMIAQLDQRDFEAALAQLEASRDQATAQLEALRAGARDEEIVALKAAVFAAEAQLQQVQDQIDRTRQLFESGTVSQARLDQDEAALRVAQANLQTAREQLAIGEAGGRAEDIAAAEAALRGLDAQVQSAKDNLSYTTLVAPFDGTISRRDIDNFTNVQAGQSIVLLQKLSTVHLQFDVPGADVPLWSSRRPEDILLEVDISDGPQRLAATELVEFSTQADAGSQTYRARVAVDVTENFSILPGMAGRVRISTQREEIGAPVVPITAIATSPESKPLVFVLKSDNSIVATPVELGEVHGHKVEVLSGVSAGDQVVAAGVSRLQTGQVVRPVAKIGD